MAMSEVPFLRSRKRFMKVFELRKSLRKTRPSQPGR